MVLAEEHRYNIIYYIIWQRNIDIIFDHLLCGSALPGILRSNIKGFIPNGSRVTS